MAQLSRPYQIALGAVAVLALVWVVALRGHSGSPSEPAPSSPPSTPATSPSGAPSPIHHGPSSRAHTTAVKSAGGARAQAHRASSAHARAHGHAPAKRAQQQLEVEHQLAQGKTVLLLFWDPKSSVDNSVRSQVLGLGKGSKGKLAVHTALADQVGLFGTVTEVAHVYQTPTILIVGRHGLITTLTGLVDGFSLKQAVREAEQANR